MRDKDGKWKPFEPLGSDLPMNLRRQTHIPEDRKQTHALEHIAQVLDRIDTKLDALLANKAKSDDS